MFNLGMLDVAIGLILVYIILSLVCSAMREALEGVLKTRAVSLERGIRELLHDPTGTNLAKALYTHPLVHGLFEGTYEPEKLTPRGWAAVFRRIKVPAAAAGAPAAGVAPVGTPATGTAAGAGKSAAPALRMPVRSNLPSYIPSRSFAVALLDIVVRGSHDSQALTTTAGVEPAPEISLATLRASVGKLQNPAVQRALLSAIDLAQGDVVRAQLNLQAWYDSTMDRVSGWYKRRTQQLLFLLGLGVTLAVNANTMIIARHLAEHDTVREAIVAQVPQLVQHADRKDDLDTLIQKLDRLDVPIGWANGWPGTPPGLGRAPAPKTGWAWWWAFVFEPVFGLLATTLAITLGAPFWFDLLNKVMVIRSTVKPHEKSPEEGSEDRQRSETRVIVEGGTVTSAK